MSYLAIIGLLLFAFPTHAQAPTVPVQGKILPVATSTTVISIDSLITADAAKYGVSREKLYKTLECESADFQDVSIRGDEGLARGIAQIRSDYHPEVTDAEADDPVFAVDFAAKAFAAGHASEWSCWRQLESKYGSGPWPN